MLLENAIGSKVLKITSAPIGSCEVKLPARLGNYKTDQPTDQPINHPTDRPTDGFIGKFHLQKFLLMRALIQLFKVYVISNIHLSLNGRLLYKVIILLYCYTASSLYKLLAAFSTAAQLPVIKFLLL